jgi:hypothetical protein
VTATPDSEIVLNFGIFSGAATIMMNAANFARANARRPTFKQSFIASRR